MKGSADEPFAQRAGHGRERTGRLWPRRVSCAGSARGARRATPRGWPLDVSEET